YYIIEAPRGAKSFVTLVDGTKIWLNAGSKISYRRNFNQENRDIFLIGEAFFEVAKNKDLPFYVHSAGIIVKAIGTAFNVKAYPEEGIVETTLVEGRVSIESTGKSGKRERILMSPNQKANFYKASHEVVIQDKAKEKNQNDIDPIPVKAKIERVEIKKAIDTDLYTSWKDKRWVFERQKLEEFSVILERLYDVKVTFKDEELKNYRLSGSFQEENLEQVLEAIQMTVPLEYSVNHNQVIFSVNKKMKSSYKKILKNVNN
ncbi:MAG TPA: FecR domain-containing protein, partial [Bacteroidales bacterium]|nr:FecR domain-containing protein [Bacteroidales bacterium]